ncbi:PREDICTED: E3 ubiquitin-protein ligase listerin [Nanorana parkeri]|uniref:E3 ubiquitin-protein ligase listerin n=1 Tax=Nanorana parkeri TaxID=125878 RepID=UPI0008541F6A|nr:PREDICTED: E3 ubiquitin-protein ligase listerin [Nanorana parkeri]
MGGKNKQRTKGNVRPSSSGRAAELLAKESGTVPGFIGFGTSQSDSGYVPAVQGAEEVDSLVDADFRMVLRKLSKRDVTTKLKAMQEFGAMCKEREIEAVRGVLPYWPRNYCKISLDLDRRVREATQQAFEQLILKVKKNLAPHLKSLMGFWLIAQCDTYSPAASAARAAFEAAFPPHKQPEALAFCKDEILNVLLDHLLKETPDSLSDPQTVPPEERESKYFRVVTCSLLALKRLLSMLPRGESSFLQERVAHLLAQSKFWKYSKHQSPSIRSAFFELISALCQYLPELLNTEASRVCPAVLLSIDDSDAVACPALWEAVLYTVTTIEKCWDYVSARKGVLPKLWTVLREGGRGLATVIFPNLLPFLSRIPCDISSPRLDFYNTLFESLIQGLSSERAMVSTTESSAILTAYMECLRFTMQENIGEDEEHRKIRHMLIIEQLIPIMDSSLKDLKLQNSPLFGLVEETIRSWEQKVENPEVGEDLTQIYTGVLSSFWESLESVCVTHVDVIEADEKELFGVSGLLQVLKNSSTSLKMSKKKKARIRFTDEEECDILKPQPPESSMALVSLSKDGPHPLTAMRQSRLQDLVCKLAELSMVYIGERESSRHLRFLAALLSAFSSIRVFQVLLEQGSDDDSRSQSNPAMLFLHQKLTVWLQKCKKEEADFLVDILYSVLLCCSEPLERKHLLEDLTKIDFPWHVFLSIIQKACSDPVKHSLICDWLKGQVLGDRLISLASDLCTSGSTDKAGKSEDKWSLLSLVLSEHVKNESLIGDIYVEKIIDKLHCTLTRTKDFSEAGDLEQSVSFICDVASNFFSSVKYCLQMPSAEDLLLTMFQLCAVPSENSQISEALILKLQHTWMCGIDSLLCRPHSLPRESKFLHRSAQWITEQLQGSHFTMHSLQTLIGAVDNLYGKILDSGPSSSHFLAEHLSLMIPSDEKWQKMRQGLSGQWSSKPLLEGLLSMNSGTSGTDLKSFHKTWLPQHLCMGAIMSKMAFRILENNALSKDGEIDARITITVAEVLYSLQWCDELEGPPATLTECCSMLRAMNITHDRVIELGDHLPGLLELLYTRSLESGTLWSLTLHKHIQLRNPGQEALKALTASTDSYFPVTQGSLHTIQCLSPFLSKDEKELLLIQFISHLMSCVPATVSCIDGGFGCLAVINSCLDSDSIPSPEFLPGVLQIIVSLKNEHEELFLFSNNLQTVKPELIGLNVEIIRFFSALLKYSSSTLPSLGDVEWDFIMCSMLAWLETACDSSALYRLPLVRLFACVSCSLASDLSGYFQAVTASDAEKLPANLISEWNEFFSEGIHSLLLPMLIKIAGESKASEMSYQSPVLQSLGEALRYISKEQLLDHKLPAKFVAGQKTNLPDSLQSLLNTLAPLLLHRERAVQITVYHMLKKVMVDLPAFDEDLKSDEEEEPVLSPPAALMSVLAVQEDLIENLLRGIPVGEFAAIQPLKEEFCFVLGYLLTWKLILTFFKAASSQLRALYSQYLRKTKSLNKLLYNLFKLMPHTPVLPGQSSDASCKDPKTFFTEELTLNVKDLSILQWEIPHLACSVYHITLKDLPAMVRLWWNGCEKRIFSVVDKFTTKYVSGVLSSQEISSVQSSTQVFDGMTVKARPTTREVIATYSVDDICIELIIQLPQNYPLGSITVESGRRVGVAVQQWRNWMLQLNTYLTHQNGSIMEGLALWKNNVDKRFEGVEDCMICFSVIHGSNYSLPKKACRTCKKKFHSECLYKWFTSSNKSTCPLCRETFF